MSENGDSMPRKLSSIVAALILSVPAVASLPAADEVSGQLCIANVDELVDRMSDCSEASLNPIPIERNSYDRAFLWVRNDGMKLVTGVIPAGSETVNLSAPDLVDFGVQFSSSDSDQWPLPVRLELRKELDTPLWTIEVPAITAAALRELRAPADVRMIVGRVAHHAVLDIRLPETGPAPRPLGEIVFQRFPVISGSVIGSNDGAGIFGAIVDAGPTSGKIPTDTLGEFEFEVSGGGWPESLLVSAPGKGSVVVPVPKVRRNVRLPAIRMQPGGSLRVGVEHDADLTVELLALVENKKRDVATHRLASGTSETVFENLAAGEYLLRVRGEGPLQQHGSRVRLEPGEDRIVDISLSSAKLEVITLKGDEPVAGADLNLQHSEADWRGFVTTDGEGRVSEPLWQTGRFGIIVSSTGKPIHFLVRELQGSKTIPLQIDIPARRVGGRITDSDTGNPVAGARIILEVDDGTIGSQLAAEAASDGTFEYLSVGAGRHKLSVSAEGFAPATLSYNVIETDGDQNLTIKMDRAVPVVVSVVTPEGHAIAAASVIDGIGHIRTTDVAGRIIIPFRPTETKTLWIVPREGSFAVTHVTAAGADEKLVTVVVPPGSATFDFEAKTADDAMTSSVVLLVRFNGQPLPRSVLDALFSHQGTLFRIANGRGSVARMPVGLYEFWPYVNGQHSVGSMPPSAIRVAAQPGVNTISMTFARP